MRPAEGGQASVFVIGMAVVTFAVAGIAVDGTRAFLLRRTLQSAADAAVSEAAMSLDQRALYEDAQLRLAPSDAREAAFGSLRERGIVAEVHVSLAPRRVVVTMRSTVPTTLLRLAGIDELPVAVQAAAEPIRLP
ncbi:MAG: pilus assembly protein TadG-related protein [Actinomycetota bacterium]